MLAIFIFLLSACAATLKAAASDNVVVYWGQNSFLNQKPLANYCDSDDVDILIVSFVIGFPKLILNFANACETTFPDGTLSCPNIGKDITYCQLKGKIILLSLGGAAGSYGFSQASQGTEFAEVLWNKFGAGTDPERPFGDAIVDGFDFDLENNQQTGITELGQALRQKFATDSTKKYYLSAAPQCPYPDYSMGNLLLNVEMDFIFIQFYNNYCSLGQWFNYDTWAGHAQNSFPNLDVKLYVGLPGHTSSAGSGYADIAKVKQYVDNTIVGDANFGGFMLWDASSGFSNIDSQGVPFVGQLKNYLLSLLPNSKSGTASSSTLSKSSTTSSSTTSSSTTSSTATSSSSVPLSSSTSISTKTPSPTNLPSTDKKVALYWGQNSFGSQKRLREYCNNDDADIFLVSFVTNFPNLVLNFASACWDSFPGGTLKCLDIGADITYCQQQGKIVLLSLGGDSTSYGFDTAEEGAKFADVLWNKFGGGTDPERPFGSAIVDGFDFDLENRRQTGIPELGLALRQKFASDTSRKYYLSAAPQCPYPDESVGDLLAEVDMDFVFIQFYNNYCALGQSFNYDTWAKFAQDASPNPDVELFVGLPGHRISAGSGYADIDKVQQYVDNSVTSDGNFGGFMLWDASSGYANTNSEGVSFVVQLKNYLRQLAPSIPGFSGSSSASSATSSATSSASSSSASSSASSSSGSASSSSATTQTPSSSAIESSTKSSQTPAGSSASDSSEQVDSLATSGTLSTSMDVPEFTSTSTDGPGADSLSKTSLDTAQPSTTAKSSETSSTQPQSSTKEPEDKDDNETEPSTATPSTTKTSPPSTGFPATSGVSTDSTKPSTKPDSPSEANSSTSSSPPLTPTSAPSLDSNKIVAFWGQNFRNNEQQLSYYCESDDIDTVVISSLIGFPNLILNFGGHCNEWFPSGLLKCPSISEDIKYCQLKGKKVLLNIGGGAATYSLQDDNAGVDLATVLWNKFGGGQDPERPFGDAVVDGFNFDIQTHRSVGIAALGKGLREKFTSGSSKSYFLSASPQCVFPDFSVGPLLTLVKVDFVLIQFYQNYCGVYDQFNFETWEEYADSSPNPNVKLFVGLPGDLNSGWGYTDITGVKSKVGADVIKLKYFGGFALWDAASSFANTDSSGSSYAAQLRSYILSVTSVAKRAFATTIVTKFRD